MRIYQAIVVAFNGDSQHNRSAVIKAENIEDVESSLLMEALRVYPAEDGFTNHQVGCIHDTTDMVRQFLQEIDAE